MKQKACHIPLADTHHFRFVLERKHLRTACYLRYHPASIGPFCRHLLHKLKWMLDLFEKQNEPVVEEKEIVSEDEQAEELLGMVWFSYGLNNEIPVFRIKYDRSTITVPGICMCWYCDKRSGDQNRRPCAYYVTG